MHNVFVAYLNRASVICAYQQECCCVHRPRRNSNICDCCSLRLIQRHMRLLRKPYCAKRSRNRRGFTWRRVASIMRAAHQQYWWIHSNYLLWLNSSRLWRRPRHIPHHSRWGSSSWILSGSILSRTSSGNHCRSDPVQVQSTHSVQRHAHQAE